MERKLQVENMFCFVFCHRFAQACQQPLTSIVDNGGFFIDNYVLSTINAVYTFVAGAHETLKVQCGENYDGVCSKFYSGML